MKISEVHIKIDGKRMLLYFVEDFENLLLEQPGKVKESFTRILHENYLARASLYQRSIVFEGVSLLLLFDQKEKRLGVFSLRAHYELFLHRLRSNPALEKHLAGLREVSDEAAVVDIHFIEKKYSLPDFDRPEFQKVYDKTLQNEDYLVK